MGFSGHFDELQIFFHYISFWYRSINAQVEAVSRPQDLTTPGHTIMKHVSISLTIMELKFQSNLHVQKKLMHGVGCK